jgi:excisionase family DNA binding protein
MTITSEPEYCTVREAAEKLRISTPTVRRWIRSGRLKAYRIGDRNIRVRLRDLQQVVRRSAMSPTEIDQLMARLRVGQAQILAQRGGVPLSSSVPIIREARAHRSAGL